MANSQSDFIAALKRYSVFRGLKESDLRTISGIRTETYAAGEVIFEQDTAILALYLVAEGQVRLVRRNEDSAEYLVRTARSGDVLGRIELDTFEGQLGTATALQPTRVLVVDKRILIDLRNRYPDLRNQFDRSEVIGHLRATPYFAPLSDLEIKWIADTVTIEQAGPGQVLYTPRDRADFVYVIRQGRVRLKDRSDSTPRWLSAGGVLGEHSAIVGRKRMAEAVTETRCHFYRLPAEDLRHLATLHREANWIGDRIDVETLLHGVPMFSRLSPHQLRHLAGYTMQIHYNRPHWTIVRQGIPDEYLYVLVRGSARAHVVDPQGTPLSVYYLAAGDSFGDGSMLTGLDAGQTIETESATDWLRIHRKDFALFLQAHPRVKGQLPVSGDLARRWKGQERVRDWQEDDELILMRTHRHIIVLLRNLTIVIAPFLLFLLLDLAIDQFSSPPWWVQLLIVSCIPAPLTLWIVLDYLNDYHIITTKRLVHEQRVILFLERRVEAPLDKVQEMHIDRSFWAQILGYGHLVIETAATDGRITFDFLPNASWALDVINDESERAKAGVQAENQESIRMQLQDRLHLGLEEKVDKRALIDEVQLAGAAAPPKSRLAIRRLVGLQQRSDNRLVWRKHWLGLLLTTFFPTLVTLGGAALLVFTLVGAAPGPSTLSTLLIALSALILLGGIGWLWWDWTDWINDLYIVSDQHIEHLEKKPFIFEEKRTILSLERVQNVEFRKSNPIAYLLNFGDVDIQTAAAEGLVTFRFVPEPQVVQTEIFRRIDNYREAQAEMRRSQRKSDISEWLSAYHQLMYEDRNRSQGA